jgi:hypothetical protein
MLRPGKRVKRNRKGEFELSIPPQEKELLRSLPGQLLDRLESGPGQPDLVRLFPIAYSQESNFKEEQEYRTLMGGDLLEAHREALRTMETTINADRLDEAQLTAWLRALNELRLVLGTRLDVTDEYIPPPATDPEASAFALYSYLSWLQSQVIDALQAAL